MTRPGRRLSQPGYTITEIAIIIAVVAVALVPLLGLFMRGIVESGETVNRSIAVELAAEALEILKTKPYKKLVSDKEHELPALGIFDVIYDRHVEVTERIDGRLLELKAKITWKEKNRDTKVSLRTLVCNPWVIER